MIMSTPKVAMIAALANPIHRARLSIRKNSGSTRAMARAPATSGMPIPSENKRRMRAS
ncbi:MAG: hypothetical protein HY688_00835 [Chloroflexi bacterium]|nr:hypothetical protein [Chloroflexota bacterium]